MFQKKSQASNIRRSINNQGNQDLLFQDAVLGNQGAQKSSTKSVARSSKKTHIPNKSTRDRLSYRNTNTFSKDFNPQQESPDQDDRSQPCNEFPSTVKKERQFLSPDLLKSQKSMSAQSPSDLYMNPRLNEMITVNQIPQFVDNSSPIDKYESEVVKMARQNKLKLYQKNSTLLNASQEFQEFNETFSKEKTLRIKGSIDEGEESSYRLTGTEKISPQFDIVLENKGQKKVLTKEQSVNVSTKNLDENSVYQELRNMENIAGIHPSIQNENIKIQTGNVND